MMIGTWTAACDARFLSCKDGPDGLLARATFPTTVVGTGRCEPRGSLASDTAGSTRNGPPRRPPERRAFSVRVRLVGHRGGSPPEYASSVVRRLFSLPPAGTAPGSSGQWRSSSGRSSSRARRSTFGGRSCTTRTSSGTSSAGERSSSRARRTPRWAPCSCFLRTVSRRRCTRGRLRHLRTMDATCPLVAKVHAEARRYAAEGYTILLVGHEGHEEVEGNAREGPQGKRPPLDTADDAERVRVSNPARVAYVTQTTLSVDETAEIVATLRRRFPQIEGPQAGRHLLRDDESPARGEGVGLRDRSAARDRLPEQLELEAPGRDRPCCRGRGGNSLIEDEEAIDERWLEGAETVGLTSGASAPEHLVRRVCDWFRARGVEEIVPLGRSGGRGRLLPAPGRGPPGTSSRL